MTTNKGIYIGPDNSLSLQTWPEQYRPVGGQALVQVQYSGVNPADMKHGEHFGLNDNVAGYEVAGTVVEAGPASVWLPGDIIFGSNAMNKTKPRSHGAHQRMVIAEEGHMWQRLPPSVPLADAAGLSIVLRTAADALLNTFQLPMPKTSKSAVASSNEAILIWGGSTQVGAAAIQLAKAAGLSSIYTTASAKHHDALLRLGATRVFDYHDSRVVEEIQNTLDEGGKDLRYVFDTVVSQGPNSTTAQCEALRSKSEIRYACVVPVFANPNWKMVVASRGHDFPSPGGFLKAQPEREVNLQKALVWATENYGNGYKVPNVRVVNAADEAIAAIQASASGKISFEKVVIQHPIDA